MHVKSNQAVFVKALLLGSIILVSGCATQSKTPESTVLKTEPVKNTSATQVDSTVAQSASRVETEAASERKEVDVKPTETKTAAKKTVAPTKKVVKKKEQTASRQVKEAAPKPKATKTVSPSVKKSKVAVKKAPENSSVVKDEKPISIPATATPVAPVVEASVSEETKAKEIAPASKFDDTAANIVEISSLDQLPLALSSDWEIDVIALPAETKKMCLLTHVQDNVFDGYEETSISVVVGLDRVWFKSKSNLDLSYPESGFQVMDKGGNLLQTKSLQLTQRPDAAFVDVSIADLPLQSADIVIKTGFWPSWPVTETRSFSVPVHNAKALTSALQTCARLLN